MNNLNEPYQLEKWVWTQEDFERMGWHDNHIHALAFATDTKELLLDLDYIFQWVGPVPEDGYFGFWVAPATVVFEAVWGVEMDISSYVGGLEILDLKREEPSQWTMDCVEGEIAFHSTGYRQYIRREPTYHRSQWLDLAERDGYSFARGRDPEAEPGAV